MDHTRRRLCLAIAALAGGGRSLFARPDETPGGAPLAGGDEALLEAVVRGDLEAVRAIVRAAPARARAVDEAGRSAFVLAHLHGFGEVAAELAAAGIETDVVEAVLGEDWERVEAWLRDDPTLAGRAHPVGGTPLYASALVGSLEGWRLRARGCDPDAAPAGGSGFTPARGALEATRSTWAALGLIDLCGNGGDVNAKQRGGSSVLHGAVARRDEALVRLAIRKGADVAAKDDRGRTAAALAAELSWEEGVTLLKGAAALPRDDRSSRFALDANREAVVRPDLSDVPQTTQNAVTGASHARLEELRRLVADDRRLVFSISTDDELAIEACAHTGNRPAIRFHLDHGAPLSLPTAVSLGDLGAVDFWLRRRPSLVNERGAHDFPVLWYAAIGGGSVEMAERLLSFGVPPDQESAGTTTLHWCVRSGDADLLAFLLERGADPEPVGHRWNREGETPLALALEAGDTPLVKLLRDGGARR